ncbi:hypothetical protein RGK94_003875, partial [Proteus mirabilis]|nr:hypothetical protein [Proteus mirabilis]
LTEQNIITTTPFNGKRLSQPLFLFTRSLHTSNIVPDYFPPQAVVVFLEAPTQPRDNKMSNFDRDLQFKILELAVNDYPNQIDDGNVPPELYEIDNKKLCANIAYLQEEGLITGGVEMYMDGPEADFAFIKATYKAIILLSEEGSISAPLNLITVKLHDDTLTAIREYINQTISDPEERRGYLQRLKELPADATKHIVLQLLGKGLNQIPDAVQWLQTVLRS